MNTEKGKVQKGRISQGPPLTTAEETELRSVTGSLQWLVASQTRPDIAVEKKQDNSTRHWSSASLLRNTAWCSKMWQSIKPPCWQATQTAPGQMRPFLSPPLPALKWWPRATWSIGKAIEAHGSVDPPWQLKLSHVTTAWTGPSTPMPYWANYTAASRPTKIQLDGDFANYKSQTARACMMPLPKTHTQLKANLRGHSQHPGVYQP